MITHISGVVNKIIAFVRSHPLLSFFVPAFGLLGATIPLAAVAPELPQFVLSVAPALLAIILAALAEGRAGVAALLGRLVQWRVRPHWYAIVLEAV